MGKGSYNEYEQRQISSTVFQMNSITIPRRRGGVLSQVTVKCSILKDLFIYFKERASVHLGWSEGLRERKKTLKQTPC